MMSTRDPYPFPCVQNDDNFVGHCMTEKLPYKVPTHLAQCQAPWSRLNGKQTLSSARREVYHHDPQAPRDSLDFILKSQYDQHNEFLNANNETLKQPETLGLEHGRVLKNRVVIVPLVKPLLNHPLKTADIGKKESIHSASNAIDGHHTQTTNRGYSRKPDGGFFTT